MGSSKEIIIAFIINDREAGDYDISVVEKGNPGIGGTQYCFVALASELAKQESYIKPVLFHNNTAAKLPEYLVSYAIDAPIEVLESEALKYHPDFIVVRGSNDLLHSKLLQHDNVRVIVWIHNYLSRKTLDFIGNSKSVCHSVFCGREQRMLAFDTACFKKSSSIFNIHYPVKLKPDVVVDPYSVVYIGSVIPSKGLHRLLRLWPSIKRECPRATLHVIGSGALYDASAKLGKHGLAEKAYEVKLFRYLKGKPSNYNVIFHGLLKDDKYKIFETCTIGIPNPTGLTECCPGSVLECSAMGLAVIGARKFGMVDTIINGKTGYLVDGDSVMKNAIIKLLHDFELAREMGLKGIDFVSKEFSRHKIVDLWMSLIADLSANRLIRESSQTLIIQGSYRYKNIIETNPGGNKKLLNIIRDTLSKIEVAESKLR